MRRIEFRHEYNDIISLENLLFAWKEFIKGKRSRKDVQEFERNLMGNIISLHNDLAGMTYEHLEYEFFRISDPKPRDIHKASVRDRLLHHALYRKLYLFFDKTFISDSYSCRFYKGTHKAVDRFKSFAYKASCNNMRTVWVLKCDIKKFFASIDQSILKSIVAKYILDTNIVWLISRIVTSYHSATGGEGVGLPLGNLTSQLLVNIYMNGFDQFMKHKLRAKYYIRYADDFVIMHHDRASLIKILEQIRGFLVANLKLTLHPDKVFIKTLVSGVDFLGWVHFSDHRVLRTATKKRMMRAIKNKPSPESSQSYLGLLKYGNTGNLYKVLLNANFL